MPSGIGSSRLSSDSPCSETPALAKANSGSTAKATQGCRFSSSCSSSDGSPSALLVNGMASATATPASVACTPDLSTHTQMKMPVSR